GGLLLERGRSQRARDSRYQRDGHVCGDRGTLVSGNPGADDAAENRLRRGDSGAGCSGEFARCALGPGWSGAAIYAFRRAGSARREAAAAGCGREEGIGAVPGIPEKGEATVVIGSGDGEAEVRMKAEPGEQHGGR